MSKDYKRIEHGFVFVQLFITCVLSQLREYRKNINSMSRICFLCKIILTPWNLSYNKWRIQIDPEFSSRRHPADGVAARVSGNLAGVHIYTKTAWLTKFPPGQ